MKTRDGSFELNLLVNGRAITEYEYRNNVLVQGRKGSEFEVEFKNHTKGRVLVVPAVDGKSVFNGEAATPESRGYLVKGNSSIRIPGWTLDGQSVAKFVFEDKDKSYASQTATESQEVKAGVIGVLVFEEKVVVQPKTVEHHHHHYPKPPVIHPTPWYPNITPAWPYNGPMLMGVAQCAVANSATSTAAAQSTRSLSKSTASLDAKGVVVSNGAPIEGAYEMGTGFGQKTEFKTNEVKFQKGDLKVELNIYYDSRRNLEKRGIQVASRETRYLDEFPSAFSGTGCKPPAGWQG